MAKKGEHLTAEHRAKISAANIGRRHSAESRSKMSASSMGQVMSAETRAKLSAIQKGKPSGNKGKHQSPEVLARLSAIRKGKPWSAKMRASMVGKHHSKETKMKMSAARRGRVVSLETRSKMGLSKVGNKYFLGRKHSDEARAKMHVAQLGNKKCLGYKHSEETREKMRKPKSAEARANISAGHHQMSVTKNTKIELKVKALLLSWGIPFLHNYRITDIGWVDFFFPQYQRVIECDGDYWHSFPERQEKDKHKDNELASRGIPILRLPEHKINKSWDSVITEVYAFLVEKTQ